MIKILVLFIVLLPLIVQARTVTWDLGNVTDETGWSSYDNKKVAIAFLVNGVEVGRVWDNPDSRRTEIDLTLSNYFIVGGSGA